MRADYDKANDEVALIMSSRREATAFLFFLQLAKDGGGGGALWRACRDEAADLLDQLLEELDTHEDMEAAAIEATIDAKLAAIEKEPSQ